MSPRTVISASGRLIRIAAYLAAAAVVVFFALTRTEVGREGLRNELERRFNESLKGRLEIGSLSGNLVNRLSARDVVVRDSAGRTVIFVDSLVLHPTWSDVLHRRISTGRVTLVRPELTLLQDEDGRWNLGSAFDPAEVSGAADPWTFHSARIDVENGRMRTRSSAPSPAAVRTGAIFDWTNADVFDIDGQVIVDWEPSMKLIDVLDLNALLVDADIDVDTLRGQLVVDSEELTLSEVHLRTASSLLHFNGSISSPAAFRNGDASARLGIDLEPSTIDGAELRRVFPALPISDTISATARLTGDFDGLVLEELTIEHGGSHLSAEGTLLGLPDSLDYDLALRPGSVRWRDLQTVWPDVPLPRFDHLGPVAVSGVSTGTLRFRGPDDPPRWRSRSEFRLESRAGRVTGDARLRSGEGANTIVEGSVDVAGFDVGRLLRRPEMPSDLNGRITIAASGASIREMEGRAAVALSPSSWAERDLDSLRVEVAGSSTSFHGSLLATDRAASVTADFTADLAAPVPSYELQGRTTRLDVGPLALSDRVSSSLNTRFTIDGRGRSWTAFEGDVRLAFDSSTVSHGASVYSIPAHHSRLAVRQWDTGSPRITLDGDVLRLEVTGDVALRPLAQLTRHWVDAAAASAIHELAKPYRRLAEDDEARRNGGVASAAVADVAYGGESATTPDLTGLEPMDLGIEVDVHRSDVLSALFPFLPALRTDLRAEAAVRLAPDHLDVRLDASADSLHAGRLRSERVHARLTAAADLDQPFSESLRADLLLEASELAVGSQPFADPRLTTSYHDHGFDISLRALASGAEAPLRLEARMDLLEDRNRLVIRDFQAAARSELWVAPGPNVIDFFQEAVHVRGVRIERAGGARSGAAEYVQIEGTLSAAPTDTLSLFAEDILVQHVGEMVGLGSDIGGRVGGRLAFTGLNRRPELTGSLLVEPLTYQDRLLGRLSVTSTYIPGSPDVALRVDLVPTTSADSTLQIENSELTLDGTFRLPGRDPVAELRDPGSLDLNLNVVRADAFFFEHIFRDVVTDVGGYIDGRGHVSGTFASPVFDADLDIRDARFHIPEFGLTYDVAGPVSVDAAGIHLEEITLADTDEGRAVVEGSILFNDYRFFSFDLRGRLDEVRIMNVPQSRELPFYGRILASGDLRLTGPLSNAMLQSSNAQTSPDSDLYIPISESGSTTDAGFIVFADSSGRVPDLRRLTRRSNLLARRPAGERPFLDGLDMDLNIQAPEGSTVHLVIDPLLGDVINAVGSGRVQLVRDEGDFSTFGTFAVTSGDYLFTAGEVFFRRFLIDSGTITWDGDPLDAILNITASYRTRASTEGLPIGQQERRQLIPLVIGLGVSGRVTTPIVDLTLSIDRADRNLIGGYEGLEALLNQPEQAAQYATSVLLTNSFLLTASTDQFAQSRGQLAFNSLSQLVASQLNRYINYALPNVNLNLGVQGESAEDLDVTYGVALRLLDERLIIRGQGIYQNDDVRRQQQGVLDEFVVEVRLNPRVSVEVFHRREGDLLSAESLNTSTTGAGLSYQTEFATWRRLIDRLFGWLYAGERESDGGGERDPNERPRREDEDEVVSRREGEPAFEYQTDAGGADTEE